MPGQERIESLVDIPAVKKEFDILKGFLEELGITIASSGKGDGFRAMADSFSKAKQGVKDLDDQTKKLQDTTDKVTDQQRAYDKTVIEAKANKQKYNAELKTEVELQNAVANSIGKAEAANKKLSAERKNLNTETAEGQQRIKEINIEIDKNNKLIEANADKLKQRKINIGNYAESLDFLGKELEQVTRKLSAFDRGAAGGAPIGRTGESNQAPRQDPEEYNKLIQQQTALKTIVSQQTVGFSSLTQELKLNERALQTMRGAGLADTDAFKKLQEQTNHTRKEFNDFNKEQKILSSDVPALTGLTVAAKGLAGAYAVGAGAAALFGDEEGKIEKEVQKLVAIMTVLQGLQEAHELLEQKDAVATAVNTAAQKAYAIVVGESTGALKFFKIALAATGIGLAIIGIAYLIQNWDKLKESISGVSKEQATLNDINHKAVESFADEITKLDVLVATLKDEKISRENKMNLLEELHSNYPKYFDDIKTEADLNEKLDKAYRKAADGLLAKARVQAAEGILAENQKKLLIEQLDVQESLNKAESYHFSTKAEKDNYLKSIVHGSAERVKEIEAQNKVVIDAIIKGNEAIDAAGGELGEVKKDKNKKNEDYGKDLAKIQDDIRKAAFDALMSRKADELTAIADIVNNEKKSFNERLDATQAYYAKKKEISDLQLAFELVNLKAATAEEKRQIQEKLKDKDTTPQQRKQLQQELILIDKKYAAEKVAIEAKNNTEIVAINADSENQITDLVTKNLDERQKKRLEDYNKRRALAQDQFEIAGSGIGTQKAVDLKGLDQQFTAGKLKKEEYEKALIEVENKYNKLSYDNQIAYYSEIIETFKLPEKEHADLIEKIAVLEQKKSKETADVKKKNDEEVLAHKKLMAEKEKELAQEVFNLIVSVVDAGYTKQINAIQDKQDVNTEAYDKEVQHIQDSALAEGEKADKLKVLQSEKEAQDNAFNLKKKLIQQEQARFNKAAGIAQITISTAQAVIAALGTIPYTPANIALAAITGAIGAVQLAKAIATPLPKYEHGTDYAKGGPSLVSEKGRELAIETSGKAFFTPDIPTIMNIKTGTKIIPHNHLDDIDRVMRNTVSNIKSSEREKDNLLAVMAWHAAEVGKHLRKSSRAININVTGDFKNSDHIQKQVYN